MIAIRRQLRRTPLLLSLFVVNTARVAAQDVPASAWGRAPDPGAASSASSSAWLGAWSPLRPISDMPRGLLRAPLSIGLVAAPPPIAGAFALTGAPGALRRDFSRNDTAARFSELHVQTATASGSYRRPLDYARAQTVAVSGQGWAPVGAHGVAIGHFVVDREDNDTSSYSARISPYTSSPFIATDSVTPEMLRTRARLEGAYALRFGEYGIGIALALESREHNSVNAPLRRSGRAASPTASFGVERGLPWLGLRLGAFHRWTEQNETNILNPNPLPTVYYPVQGLDEPPPLALNTGTALFTRTDRRATSNGASVELSVFRTVIVGTYERGQRAEDSYTSVFASARPTDRWRAGGGEARAELQRVFRTNFHVTIVGSNESVRGDASRNDLTGIAFRSHDQRRAVEADIRLSGVAGWQGAIIGGAVRTVRDQRDFVVSKSANVVATAPFVGGEIARAFGNALISVGASTVSTSSTGTLPLVTSTGPNYQRVIAPELAYEAAQARAVAAWIATRVRLAHINFVGSIRAERTAPEGAATARLQPVGRRNGFSISVGTVQ